jgi:hypothetical protein
VVVVQEIWAKFNANERLVGIGAVVIIVSWIVGLVGSYGFGTSIVALLGAIAALVVLYLKYSPTSNVTWPAPVPVILLTIGIVVGIVQLIALLQLLSLFGALSLFGGIFALYLIAAIGTIVGAAIMLWGSYQEWNASKRTA